MAYPVNQPNPAQQQAPQNGLPPQGGGALGGTGAGYTAQGPVGPIQATANTIGAQAPQGAGATRSGSFAQPTGMMPSKPLIQGMDSTLGAGMPGGTYSYLFANGGMPGYADGGMPGMMPPPTPQMQGQPQQQQPPMQGQMQNAPMQGPQPQGPGPTDPRMMSMQLDQVLAQNPQISQQLVQAAQQIGITPQNAEQVSKIVMLAIQRPELYPQIRQYCIQAFGLDEADLPPQFDPQFMSTLAVLAHAGSQGSGLSSPPPPDQSGQQSMVPPPPGMQPQGAPQGAQGGPQGAPPQQGQTPQQALGGPPMGQGTGNQQLQGGGAISGPGTGTSDSITARVSDGEFVIPADVVKAKGTEFFQKLLDSYHTPVNRGQQ